MDKIYHAYISRNNGRIGGSTEIEIGYFKFPVNAWSEIVDYINDNVKGFVYMYTKEGNTKSFNLYEVTVDEFIKELSTGLVTYVNINSIDYYLHVEEIKIKDL